MEKGWPANLEKKVKKYRLGESARRELEDGEREEGREEERELETVRKEVNESCINSVCNKQ